MTAAEKLKAWRKSAGLSQEAAGERIGVVQAAWSDYEAGHKKPHVEQAIRISEITEDSPHHVSVRDWRESDEARGARVEARKARKRTIAGKPRKRASAAAKA